jgi:2-polyprenyl-6-methoxyphenol hydroxylase-like FAD-dependent oxidoreductase
MKPTKKPQCSGEVLDTDVLIIGAGPAGLSMAIELGTQGHRCLVVERHEHVGLAPRAKTTNVRTRELLRRWGIADRLADESPFGVDYPSNVVFATRLAGYELHRFANGFNCNPERDERFSEHAQWIPQYKVEAVLKTRAGEFPGVNIRFETELKDFKDHGDHVTAVLADVTTGEQTSVRASYIVGADGARSTVREKLGIKMSGISPLGHNHNIIFHSPGLAARHELGPAVMYWLINSEVPSVISPLDSGDRWTFGCPKLSDASVDPALLIRTALGFGSDIEIEILSRDEWTAHQLIAERYATGRAFLIGDACHLHPPYGGYGMNMGIGDAMDLGWKLSAVLSGWGGAKLLSSYEIERRQVHMRVVEESVTNNAASTRKLVMPGMEDAGSAGDAVRAEVGATIAEIKAREFHSLGVVLGSRYRTSPVLAEAAPGAKDLPDAGDYMPLARPGCLAPHAWLEPSRDKGSSLYDQFSARGFTLLVTRQAVARAADALVQAAAATGMPLKLVVLPLQKLNALYGCDYALIRPDHYIAWCGDSIYDAIAVIDLVVGKSLEAVT